jgi:hypothetical protein
MANVPRHTGWRLPSWRGVVRRSAWIRTCCT